jgi:hypothetical protein
MEIGKKIGGNLEGEKFTIRYKIIIFYFLKRLDCS